MDVKYLNPFLNSFTSVLPLVGLNNIEKKGLSIKGRHIQSPGVVIIVGIMGDIKGNVIYATTVDNAKKIASTMMMGMPVDELNELAQSAISELTNMLTANAATEFSNEGISINISTPTLVYGEFIANSSSEKVLSVELLIDGMSFEVNIALESIL